MLILMVSFCLQITGAEEKTAGGKKISAELLRKDLEFLVRSLEEIHPDLYANYNRDLFKNKLKQVTAQINRDLSALEFYKLIAPLVARLGDAHTSLAIPFRLMAEHVRGGGKIFPFDVNCQTGKVIIKENYSSLKKIRPGMEIVSINGISSKTLLKKITSFLSPRKEKFRRILAGDLFSAYLYLLYGFDSGFTIEIKEKGKVNQVPHVVKGVLLQEINRKRSERKNELKMKFKFTSYPENNAGVMTIDSFSGSGNFMEFLRETFLKLRQEKIKHLIVDIRKNSGGDSRLCEALAGYLTDRPVDLVSKTRIKVSRQVKQMFREKMKKADRSKLSPEALRYLRKIMETGDGKILELAPEERGRGINSLRFSGKVYLLTGIRTFSSAVLFAAAFKDYRMGTIFGEETGAPASHFGEIFSFNLPNSKLNVRVSYKYFIRPDGRAGVRGVIPHHQVAEDQVLQFVLEQTKKL